MPLWANSSSRDLHLDLREAITPGARGVRELLLTALRDAVRSGRLAAGTMLPPSRSLATDLGLARNTVAEAYAELVAEGWLASRQGAGTWVVNTSGAQMPGRPRGVRVVPTHNLLPGSPDVAEFPRSEWVAATRRALTNAPTAALRMGDPRAQPELRAALAESLARAASTSFVASWRSRFASGSTLVLNASGTCVALGKKRAVCSSLCADCSRSIHESR